MSIARARVIAGIARYATAAFPPAPTPAAFSSQMDIPRCCVRDENVREAGRKKQGKCTCAIVGSWKELMGGPRRTTDYAAPLDVGAKM